MAVSDQEIAESLHSLFRETDPRSFTSLNEVVGHLQHKLGFDLSSKTDFIRAQIGLIFSARPPPPPQPSQPIPPQPHPTLPPQHQHTTMTATAASNPMFRASPGVHAPPASHFGPNFGMPRGATEINFAQPGLSAAGDVAGNVVIDSAPVKESAPAKPKRRGGAGGLNKLCSVSPQLEAVVGQPAMPRTEIVRQLWAYIRKNNLQDPNNKRKIICNDELRLLFDTDCTDMFQMNKLLARHITPLKTAPAPAPATAPADETEQKAKRQKFEESSGVTPSEPNPVVISEALANFFGASGKEMLQTEIFRRLDEYIKDNGLEDPSNSVVMCDAKLQELFGSESIPAQGRYEMLARHHIIQHS